MHKRKMVKFFTQIYPEIPLPYPGCRHAGASSNKEVILTNTSRLYSESSDGKKGPSKVEQIEQLKMPGFVHPETMNEEGYFTQKARQQLEELKKRLEKPKVNNTEKSE